MGQAGQHPNRRTQSRGEIVADGVVHALGLGTGLVGATTLVTVVAMRTDALALVFILIYAFCLMAMLCCSAAYNLARLNRRRELLRRLDHAAIFLMIAGTYTPFTCLWLDTAWAVGLMAIVWSVATAGIVIKLCRIERVEFLSIPLYLGLGWIVLFALDPIVRSFRASTLTLLALGGVLYTVGITFHLWKRLPFQNALWHAFVVAAAGVHYAALFGAVLDDGAT